MATGMIIDGVAASEAIDSSGEILDVRGCDISDLENGVGLLNWEHRNDESPGASPLDIVGKIVYARKIYKEDDCESERQKKYWRKVKLPFIYIVGRLYDGAGHEGAKALAAQIRDHVANDEAVLVRFSVEGSTLLKEGNKLVRSIARRVACTVKPCNRSCNSGVLEDPNAPKGFETKKESTPHDPLEEVTKKSEHPHPNYTPLGGQTDVECDPRLDRDDQELRKAVKALAKLRVLRKATTAGTTSAAPSALTGGAALQREDPSLHRAHLKNLALATLRDYGHRVHSGNKADFVKFCKHRMPEADDSFVDHFADLVEDYKLRKGEPKRKASKKVSVQPVAEPREVEVDEENPQEPAIDPAKPNLTVRGAPVQANPTVKKPSFDERTGTLHTPRGSFQMYIPSRDPTPGAAESFHNIMNDPKVSNAHDYAVRNWARLHDLLKKGKLPPEVIMHATLFSQLSPNTPVPSQELMYGHLVDSMKQTGLDPRKPGAMAGLGQDWLSRDKPDKFPEHSREYFEGIKSLRAQSNSDPRRVSSGRQKGDIKAFMLANNKLKNMAQYHTLHDALTDLVARHGSDARGGVAELMQHKHKGTLHEAVRQRSVEKGKPDPGPYTAGPLVPGLAPKTARYMYGMLGGGNVHVPDTHFTRYLFGLDKKHDADSIAYLKSVLWNKNNSRVLDAIDRYYGANHDAVKHMREHPEHGRLFENPDDAVFPAFWKNWTAIVPHERARGFKTRGENEGTTHVPYWDAVEPYTKHEHSYDLPSETAAQHAAWVEQYGEMPALQMYYEHLVPKLLAAHSMEKAEKLTRLMERLTVEMRLAKAGVPEPEDDEFDPFPAAPPVPPPKVHSEQHGHHLKTPEQHAMVHGFQPGGEVLGRATAGINRAASAWRMGGHGYPVYHKMSNMDDLPDAHREVAYHNIARDFFGLGDHVPTTAAFKHPETGKLESIQEGVAGAEHMRTVGKKSYGNRELRTFGPEHAANTLQRLGDNGTLDRMAVMNYVLGNGDRHRGNFVFSPSSKAGMHLIDHGHAFDDNDVVEGPSYLDAYVHQNSGGRQDYLHEAPAHPDAVQWALNLDPELLRQHLQRHEIPRERLEAAMRRLHGVQTNLRIAGDTPTKQDLVGDQ